MEVILLQKVANLGNIGDRVKVRSGFGRNFLLPQGKATLATPDNVARFEARRAELERLAREHMTSAEERAVAMKDFKLTIHAKAGTEGKLFGSIGTADIAEAATAGRLQGRAQRGAHARRTAAHGRRAHRQPAPARRRRRAAAGDDRGGRVARTLGMHVAGTAKTRGDSGCGRTAGRAGRRRTRSRPSRRCSAACCSTRRPGTTLPTRSTQEDFYRPDHRLIFEAIAALAGEAKPCDVVTVSAAPRAHRQARGRRRPRLSRAPSRAIRRRAANVRAYADIVRERSLLRQLIRAGTDIAAAVFSERRRDRARPGRSGGAAGVRDRRAGAFARREGALAVRTLLPAVIDQIDEWHNNPDKLRGLPTGFTDFDKITGGLRPGDLIIVAGRPSMGKTTLAVNMAEYAAVHPGTRASVAIFSMEMPSEQVITRMLSSIGGVPLNSLRSGKISDEDWVRITGATSQLSEAKLFVDETPALNPTELRARARRVKREHGLHLIVVDYLQLMQVPGTKENRATEIAEISRGLKALAKELQVPVIALSQLNRAVEQRERQEAGDVGSSRVRDRGHPGVPDRRTSPADCRARGDRARGLVGR